MGKCPDENRDEEIVYDDRNTSTKEERLSRVQDDKQVESPFQAVKQDASQIKEMKSPVREVKKDRSPVQEVKKDESSAQEVKKGNGSIRKRLSSQMRSDKQSELLPDLVMDIPTPSKLKKSRQEVLCKSGCTVFSKEDSAELEGAFLVSKHPKQDEVKALGDKLGRSAKEISTWFARRRIRATKEFVKNIDMASYVPPPPPPLPPDDFIQTEQPLTTENPGSLNESLPKTEESCSSALTTFPEVKCETSEKDVTPVSHSVTSTNESTPSGLTLSLRKMNESMYAIKKAPKAKQKFPLSTMENEFFRVATSRIPLSTPSPTLSSTSSSTSLSLSTSSSRPVPSTLFTSWSTRPSETPSISCRPTGTTPSNIFSTVRSTNACLTTPSSSLPPPSAPASSTTSSFSPLPPLFSSPTQPSSGFTFLRPTTSTSTFLPPPKCSSCLPVSSTTPSSFSTSIVTSRETTSFATSKPKHVVPFRPFLSTTSPSSPQPLVTSNTISSSSTTPIPTAVSTTTTSFNSTTFPIISGTANSYAFTSAIRKASLSSGPKTVSYVGAPITTQPKVPVLTTPSNGHTKNKLPFLSPYTPSLLNSDYQPLCSLKAVAIQSVQKPILPKPSIQNPAPNQPQVKQENLIIIPVTSVTQNAVPVTSYTQKTVPVSTLTQKAVPPALVTQNPVSFPSLSQNVASFVPFTQNSRPIAPHIAGPVRTNFNVRPEAMTKTTAFQESHYSANARSRSKLKNIWTQYDPAKQALSTRTISYNSKDPNTKIESRPCSPGGSGPKTMVPVDVLLSVPSSSSTMKLEDDFETHFMKRPSIVHKNSALPKPPPLIRDQHLKNEKEDISPTFPTKPFGLKRISAVSGGSMMSGRPWFPPDFNTDVSKPERHGTVKDRRECGSPPAMIPLSWLYPEYSRHSVPDMYPFLFPPPYHYRSSYSDLSWDSPWWWYSAEDRQFFPRLG